MSRPLRTTIAAAALCVTQAATAQDSLPRRKPGLWEATTEAAQRPGRPMKTQQCVDAKTDAALQRRVLAGEGSASCQSSPLKKHRGGFEMTSTCKTSRGTAITQVSLKGSMNSDYRIDASTRFEPPISGLAEARRSIHARWTGPCPADMKPGDMRIDGKVVSALGKPD
jgi:hypothetical protein